MLQFNIYRSNDDSDLFWNDFLNFRSFLISHVNTYDLNKNSHYIENQLSKHYNSRYLLIASKLYTWGVISSDFLRIYISTTLNINHDLNFSLWEIEELFANLGNSELQITLQPYNIYNTNTSEKLIPSPDIQKTRFTTFILYKPILSGFFSILENIILAEYCINNMNCAMVIDNSYDWWPYPIKFEELFPDKFIYKNEIKAPFNQHIDTNIVRTFFNSTINNNYNFLCGFHYFKSKKYEYLKTLLKQFITNKKILLPFDDSLSIFLRYGDKIQQESLPLPINLILTEAHNFDARTIYIVGDHYNNGQLIADKVGGINLISKNMSGYLLSNIPNSNEFLDIIYFYIIMSETNYVIGSASNNIVNASLWSSKRDLQYRSVLHSCKSIRFTIN